MIISILVLFGEGARGLDGGVVVTTFRWGGEDSSPSTSVSEASKVCDVLVRGATSRVGTSSSSSLRLKIDSIKSKMRQKTSTIEIRGNQGDLRADEGCEIWIISCLLAWRINFFGFGGAEIFDIIPLPFVPWRNSRRRRLRWCSTFGSTVFFRRSRRF